MIQILSDSFYIVKNLTAEQIALVSIFISFIIYILSKRAEIKLKKYEAKKEEYAKFIAFMVNFFSKHKEISKGNLDFMKEFEKDYYELGAALSIYGSKKLYNEYCFFRRITTDEAIQKLKYFDNYLTILSFGRMFKIIRREAGLNYDLISIPKSLSFVINDITKPQLMIQYYKNRYNRIMIKFMILGSNLKSVHWLSPIYYCFIKPIISILVFSFSLLVLNLIVKPIKKIFGARVKREIRG